MRRLAPILLAVVALSGCGDDGPSDSEQVRDVLQSFATAVEERDYEKLCDEIFAEELLEGLKQIALPCEVAMQTGFGNRQDPKLTVGEISIDGTNATAEIRTSAEGEAAVSGTIELKKLGDQWQVSGLGGDPEPSPSGPSGPTPTPAP